MTRSQNSSRSFHRCLRPFVLLLAGLLLPAAVLAAPQAPAAASQAACKSDGDCGANQFCKSKLGMCGKPGKCTDRPEICFLIFDPVCGCDGKTYSNSCFAAMNGVSVAATGPCDQQACRRNQDCADGFFCFTRPGDCGGQGQCNVEPEICPLIFLPVCGCDGKTYSNPCFAFMSGTSVASEGECPGTTCDSNESCGEGELCFRRGFRCEGKGMCEERPEVCPEIFDPVCGCDGKTYSNQCFAAAAGVNVAHDGPCEE